MNSNNPYETFLGLVYKEGKYVKKEIPRQDISFSIKDLENREDDFYKHYNKESNFYVLTQGFGKRNIDYIYKEPNFIKPILIYSKGAPYEWLKQDNVKKITLDEINELEKKIIMGDFGDFEKSNPDKK